MLVKRYLIGAMVCMSSGLLQAAPALHEINIERKIQECKDLVAAAASFFQTNTLDKSCHDFLNSPRWRRGEIEIFLFDDNGICFLFGAQRDAIWKDFKPEGVGEENLVNKMLKKGKVGGFVNFLWNNGYMHSFVQTVVKEGKSFIIGAGFYPESGKYLTEQLVESALEAGDAEEPSVVFERMNNPTGKYVNGNIFLSAYTLDGVCIAHGRSLELLGQNMTDYTSADGKHIIRDMIALAKSKGKGWISYKSRAGGVEEHAYAAMLTDKNGKQYIIVGAYYPNVNEADVRAMVKKAVSYMRVHGAQQSFPEFSQPNGRFAVGGISLFVYDMEGKIVADMENPAFIGQNLINTVDQDGRPVTKVIIQQAKTYTSGWVSFHLKNSYALMYIEKVSLNDGDFVVGAAYFPAGKQVTVRFMVEKAARYVEQKTDEFALGVFTSGSSDFLRGDVFIEIVQDNGTILVDGSNHHRIWEKDLGTVDEKGKAIIQKLISIAKSGGGWVQYPDRNSVRRVYAKQAIRGRATTGKAISSFSDKNQAVAVDTYVILSGYYL